MSRPGGQLDAAPTTPAQSRVPAVVCDVEATVPIAIPDHDEHGRRAGLAWILVRHHSEPLGTLSLPLPPGGLSAAEVAAAINSTFGAAVGTRTADDVAARRAVVLATAPPITVVVCTRDRPESLARTLASLRAQAYPRMRVLVVDSASRTGRTHEVAQAADVDYLRVPVPGLSRARNAALAATDDELLAWIDDDAVADGHWLTELAGALAETPQADVVCGAIVPAQLETPAQLWFEEFGGLVKGRGFTPALFGPGHREQSPLFPLPPFGAGGNMLTRRAALVGIGGFDPALGAGTPAAGGEDTLAFTRVLLRGGTIAYRPGALVRHYHRDDLAGLRAQLVGYGTGLTAAYTSLVLHSPGVLPGLVKLAPRALREVLRGGDRTDTLGPDFPRELLRANRRGMLRGPATYLRGRAARPR